MVEARASRFARALTFLFGFSALMGGWLELEAHYAAGHLPDRLSFAWIGITGTLHTEVVAAAIVAGALVAACAYASGRFPALGAGIALCALAPLTGAIPIALPSTPAFDNKQLAQIYEAATAWSAALFAVAALGCLAITALAWRSRRRAGVLPSPWRPVAATLAGVLVVAPLVVVCAKRSDSAAWCFPIVVAVVAIAVADRAPRDQGVIAALALCSALAVAASASLVPPATDFSGMRYVPGPQAPWWAGGYDPEKSMRFFGIVPDRVVWLAQALEHLRPTMAIAAIAWLAVIVSWLVQSGPRAFVTALRSGAPALLVASVAVGGSWIAIQKRLIDPTSATAFEWPRAAPVGFRMASAPAGGPHCVGLDPRRVVFIGPTDVVVGGRAIMRVEELRNGSACARLAATFPRNAAIAVAVDDSLDYEPVACLLAAVGDRKSSSTDVAFLASASRRGAAPLWPTCLPVCVNGERCRGASPLVIVDDRTAWSIRERDARAIRDFPDQLARYRDGRDIWLRLPESNGTALGWTKRTSMQTVHASLFFALQGRRDTKPGIDVAPARPVRDPQPLAIDRRLSKTSAHIDVGEPPLQQSQVASIEHDAIGCWQDQGPHRLHRVIARYALVVDAGGHLSDTWRVMNDWGDEAQQDCFEKALASRLLPAGVLVFDLNLLEGASP